LTLVLHNEDARRQGCNGPRCFHCGLLDSTHLCGCFLFLAYRLAGGEAVRRRTRVVNAAFCFSSGYLLECGDSGPSPSNGCVSMSYRLHMYRARCPSTG
jgi:hypothetical protein